MVAVLLAALIIRNDIEVLDKSGNRLGVVQVSASKLSSPKLSPRKFGEPVHRWEFGWRSTIEADTPNGLSPRFQIYSQDEKTSFELAPKVGRMLLRLWNYNYTQLGLDHSSEYGRRVVEVYLCQGGAAGGEQLIDVDPDSRERRKVNTIYIYEVGSFSNPVEMAREVAHEYGHASIPAVGGFDEPEYWANGYLGERVFLKYASEALPPEDTMGVPQSDLQKWLRTNVDPLVAKAAVEGPNAQLLGSASKKAMDAYIGLVMYAATLLPHKVFSRSLILMGSTSAKDYPDAIVTAAEEPEKFQVQVPAYLQQKSFWLPLGKGTLTGAKVVQRKGAWALIKPTGPSVVVTPKLSN